MRNIKYLLLISLSSVFVLFGSVPTVFADESWCHDFNLNLKIGDQGSEVVALQTVLEKEGFSVPYKTGYFGKNTAAAAVDLQEKYKESILTPSGLKQGTGYVGRATRAKLNNIYSCQLASTPTPTPTPAPTPTPIFPPATTTDTPSSQTIKNYDVVVYGGTSAGVTAAVQAARMGKTVVIIEPSNHLGGMTSNGLGATDIGNGQTVGGIAKEFYQNIYAYYSNSANWQYGQSFDAYKNLAVNFGHIGADTMSSFEPHVAENIFKQFLQIYSIPVFYNERLNFNSGVIKNGSNINQIVMDSGTTFKGKIFIDATYEGDLMAKSGVSYAVGRESNSLYQETLNGVIFNTNGPHQFALKVDPYVTKGNPASGLLPGVNLNPGVSGQGDNKIQAYNFRLCTTDISQNAIPWFKPDGYDSSKYELLLRYFEAGYGSNISSFNFGYISGVPWAFIPMPNRKTDTNNNGAFSTDNIEMNYNYPDGDYAVREKIIRDHVLYQQGLFWTLSTDPRTPQNIRNEINKWGLCKDEFTDNGGWPNQIYVREARRMVSDYVMTENDCKGNRKADDSVGLGSYPIDSHNVQRYLASGGYVQDEGDLVGMPGTSLAKPYTISYRSVIPKKQEITNLLVPVALSSSHAAYGSIRMEPVFMILGQSVGAAASIAIDDNVAAQSIDYNKLKQQLIRYGQILNPGESSGEIITTIVGPDSLQRGDALKMNWFSTNAVACRIYFEGTNTSVNNLLPSGSYSFPTDDLTAGKSYIYAVRCFSGEQVSQYGKNTANISSDKGVRAEKSVLILESADCERCSHISGKENCWVEWYSGPDKICDTVDDDYLGLTRKEICPDSRCPNPYITLVSPNNGEKWPLGSLQQIKFQSNRSSGVQGKEKVTIQLLRNNVYLQTIDQSITSSDGSIVIYQWQVPSSLSSGDDYKIKVILADFQNDISDISDLPFSLTPIVNNCGRCSHIKRSVYVKWYAPDGQCESGQWYDNNRVETPDSSCLCSRCSTVSSGTWVEWAPYFNVCEDPNAYLQNRQEYPDDSRCPITVVGCNRCSNVYDYTRAVFKSQNSDCVTPIEGTVQYSCDCSCGANKGQTWSNCTEQCQPMTHCNRCSGISANQRVDFYTTDSICINPYNNPITRTCDCSCPSQGLDTSWDSGCISSCVPVIINNCGRCSNVKRGVYVTWYAPDGQCESGQWYDNNRIEASNSGCLCARCSTINPGTWVEWAPYNGACEDPNAYSQDRQEYPNDSRCLSQGSTGAPSDGVANVLKTAQGVVNKILRFFKGR